MQTISGRTRATLVAAAAVFASIMAMTPSAAPAIASTNDLIAAMQQRYGASWYKTATFVQKTTNFAPDGTPTVATWYEALAVPGSLRIDFTPETDGNGILFTAGQVFNFKDGKQTSARPYVHPLMLLGFDIYKLSKADVVSQMTGLKFDLTKFHAGTWQNRPVYIVGADAGDEKSAQFWIDQENLYFVRMLRLAGPNGDRLQDTEFNKYVKLGGGWMAPEVVFKTDGKVTTTEEYSELRADPKLPDHLFDPAFWTTVHWRK
jgi:outer membrane lipoprotein-sorting protein